MVGNVGAGLGHFCLTPTADFADFHKATTLPQCRQTALDKRAVEAIEHHIHPTPAGEL